MQGTVVLLDPVHPRLPARLEAAGIGCVDVSAANDHLRDHALSDAVGVVVRSRTAVDKALLQKATRLRFVARSGVGVEHIDVAAAHARQIEVLTSPEASRDALAEHAIGMLLALMHRIAVADRQIRAGGWPRAQSVGTQLRGKTVGIVGYGNMGQAFASRVHGFGCAVVAYDRWKHGFGDAQVREVNLATLQAHAEIVSLHIPGSDDNHRFVNEAFFEQCAHPIWLVNTARGSVVDTQALVKALDCGKVCGAALDVLEFEAPSFSSLQSRPLVLQQLLQADNVLITPHVAGASVEAEPRHADVLADKILALLAALDGA